MDGDVFTLTAEQAAGILADVVPGAPVAGVEHCAGGQMSGAYEVRLAGPPEAVIVKVYAPDAADAMVKERHVYGLLDAHGVTAMPRVLGGAAEADALGGRAFLAMTKLAGRTLGAVEATLTPGELAEVYHQRGAILAGIHRVECEAFGYRYRDGIYDPQPTNAAFMTRLAAEKLAGFAGHDGDPKLGDAVRAFVGERVAFFERCETPRLVHNDFHEGNVLIDRDAAGAVVTGFIDLENALAGDPMADIAKTHSYDIGDDAVKLGAFEAGYGGFPADWREAAALYRAVHALELWIFFHQTGKRRFLGKLDAELREITAAG